MTAAVGGFDVASSPNRPSWTGSLMSSAATVRIVSYNLLTPNYASPRELKVRLFLCGVWEV